MLHHTMAVLLEYIDCLLKFSIIVLGLAYVYYAFEQCSKIFPIISQLCMLQYAQLCSIMVHELLLPESEV